MDPRRPKSSTERLKAGPGRHSTGTARTQGGVGSGEAETGTAHLGPGDEELQARVEALKRQHAQKTRALLRSIDQLKEQNAALKAQSKDHARSQLIRGLKLRTREEELVSETLKQLVLREKSDWTENDVNDYVIRKTVGGPKRFRPKTREELQMQLHKQSQQLRRLMAARQRSRGAEGSETGSLAAGRAAEGGAEYDGTSAVESRLGANDTSGRHDDSRAEGDVSDREAALVEELEALRVQVQAKDATLRDVTEELEEAQEEAREGKSARDRARRAEAKLKQWREQAETYHRELLAAQREREEALERCRELEVEQEFAEEHTRQVEREAQKRERSRLRSSQEGGQEAEEVKAELEATRRELSVLQSAMAHGGGQGRNVAEAQSRAAAAEQEAREFERRLTQERLAREEEVGQWRSRAERVEARTGGEGEEEGHAPAGSAGSGAGGGVQALRERVTTLRERAVEAEDARVAAEGRAQLAEGKLALEQAALEREKEYAARLKEELGEAKRDLREARTEAAPLRRAGDSGSAEAAHSPPDSGRVAELERRVAERDDRVRSLQEAMAKCAEDAEGRVRALRGELEAAQEELREERGRVAAAVEELRAQGLSEDVEAAVERAVSAERERTEAAVAEMTRVREQLSGAEEEIDFLERESLAYQSAAKEVEAARERLLQELRDAGVEREEGVTLADARDRAFEELGVPEPGEGQREDNP